ncbi:Rhs element Vgr protein [Pseudomonas syringae group genomosp. 3]|nr:Rhs element Vgr protein [Pseudomonas syringae group genomosp. 3]
MIDQRGNNRGGLRGTGFELRTDAYGALRAQQGLYLSTWKRSGAQGAQIDASEAKQQLKNSEQRVKTLSDTAQQHNALPMQEGLDSLTQLNSDADVTYDSDDGAPSQGPGEQQRNGGDTAWAIRSGGRGKTPGYQQPLLIASSPADIATATPKSTHVHSGKHLTLSTGEDVSIASGKSLLASVAQSISLFAQNAGAKLFAAKGKIELQAQSDAMELTAQQKVMITSTAAGIEIAAQEGILLTSGGGYIRIKDGDIEIHAPGTIDIKGAKKTLSGPTQLNRNHPAWPESSVTQALTFYAGQTNAGSSSAWAGMPYKLRDGVSVVKQGVMDKTGAIDIDHHPTTSAYILELASGMRYDIPVGGQYTGEQSNAERANSGFHRHEVDSPSRTSPPRTRSEFRAEYTDLDTVESEKEI